MEDITFIVFGHEGELSVSKAGQIAAKQEEGLPRALPALSSRSLPDLYTFIVTEAQRHADGAHAALYVRDGELLQCVAVCESSVARKLRNGALPPPREWPPLEPAKIVREPLFLHDGMADARWDEAIQLWPGREKIRTYIGLPLHYDGRLVGYLSCADEKPGGPTLQRQQGELRIFGEAAAMTLYTAALLEQQATMTWRAELRAGIALSLLPLHDSDAILQEVVRRLGEGLDATYCMIFLRTATGELACAATYQRDLVPFDSVAEIALRPIIKDAVMHEHLVWTHDLEAGLCSEEIEPGDRDALLARGIRALALAPLQQGSSAPLGVLATLQVGEGRTWEQEDSALVKEVAAITGQALADARAVEQIRDSAVREERERLAREIHDTLAQTITGVVMQLDAVVRATPHESALYSRIEQACTMARSAMAETRRAVWNLRPSQVNLQEPRTVIQEELGKLEQRIGLRPELLATGEERQIVPELGAVVQRLVRVCLENIWMHSKARRVRIRLDYGLQTLSVLVEDDGLGFDPETIDLRSDGRVGLAGVAERIRLIGGHLRVESALGQGTRVHAELPYVPTEPLAASLPLGTEPATPPAPATTDQPEIRIRVLLIDDHTVMREGLARMLQDQPDLQVVGTAATGSDGLRLIAECQPDVVLCDLQLPDISGVQVISKVRTHFPQVRCLVLTTYDNDDYIYEGIKAGAKGYVLKDVSFAELVGAVRAAARNESLLQPVVARKLVERFSEMARQGEMVETLTEREASVLRLLGSGLRNKEIAFQLGLSESTIKTHLASIFGKLNVTTRTEAVTKGREIGIIAL